MGVQADSTSNRPDRVTDPKDTLLLAVLELLGHYRTVRSSMMQKKDSKSPADFLIGFSPYELNGTERGTIGGVKRKLILFKSSDFSSARNVLLVSILRRRLFVGRGSCFMQVFFVLSLSLHVMRSFFEFSQSLAKVSTRNRMNQFSNQRWETRSYRSRWTRVTASCS